MVNEFDPAEAAAHGIVLLESMGSIIEIVNGYRAKMVDAGYSPAAAETMAVDFHRMMLDSIAKSTG